MIQILQSELFRIRRRSQSWIMFAISIGLVVLFYAGFVIAHIVNPDSRDVTSSLNPANAEDNGLVIAQLIGPILVVVFGAGLIGSEFSWNTLRPLIARSRSRASLLTAKWAALGIFTVVLTVATVTVTYLSAAVGTLIAGEDVNFGSGLLGDVLGYSLRYSAALIPSAVLAMVLALVFRSNAVGIAVGIAISLIEPILFLLLGTLSDVFETIEKGSMTFNITQLMQFGSDSDVTASDAWTSAGVLGIWIVGLMTLSYIVFNRRDVTSG